jgi:hypothetical protein
MFKTLGMWVALIGATAYAQEKLPPFDWETYVVRQSSIAHSHPVSFSIGYPKTWTKMDLNRTPAGESFTYDEPLVCSFTPGESAFVKEFRGFMAPSIMIQRAFGTSAKAEASAFAQLYEKSSLYTRKTFSQIETRAGERGYLVVFEIKSENGLQIDSEFFFHAGSKGAIRISIMTQEAALSEKLQNLVLESLRF